MSIIGIIHVPCIRFLVVFSISLILTLLNWYQDRNRNYIFVMFKISDIYFETVIPLCLPILGMLLHVKRGAKTERKTERNGKRKIWFQINCSIKMKKQARIDILYVIVYTCIIFWKLLMWIGFLSISLYAFQVINSVLYLPFRYAFSFSLATPQFYTVSGIHTLWTLLYLNNKILTSMLNIILCNWRL